MTSQLLVHGRSFSHIQFAVKQDQALGHAVLRQVKAGQLPLGRVSFALLLSLVRTVRERFHEPVVQHHAATFGEAWAKASSWLASATSALLPLSPEALLARSTRYARASLPRLTTSCHRFRLYSMVRPAVIDLICDRRRATGSRSSTSSNACSRSPYSNMLPEYGLTLPPPVATTMLT